MPDVSPPQLVSARKGYFRVYGPNPDATPGICGLCARKVDPDKQEYVISVDGVWAHFECINGQTYDPKERV